MLALLQPFVGLALICFLAWCCSDAKQRFPARLLLTAVLMQFVLVYAFLNLPLLSDVLLWINTAVQKLEQACLAGTSLVFGYLGGGPAPFELSESRHLFILAFRSLPIIIVFSALTALLWHWRVTPFLINLLARALRGFLGLKGDTGLGAASSLFLGMVEAPLMIKAHLASLGRADLFVLMSCGMATVAGSVMGLYAVILSPVMQDALSHILVASVCSIPAAIALAFIMRPGNAQPVQPDSMDGGSAEGRQQRYRSSMHALTRGTEDGLKLLLNVIAMLIVFVSLVALLNAVLAALPVRLAGEPLSLQGALALLFRPLVWALGIPGEELDVASRLLADKVIINELVAYLHMSELSADALSPASRVIMTYALCGFANFGSLGILLGGLLSLCPQRSDDILALAPWSLLSGLLATCMTGAVVAVVQQL